MAVNYKEINQLPLCSFTTDISIPMQGDTGSAKRITGADLYGGILGTLQSQGITSANVISNFSIAQTARDGQTGYDAILTPVNGVNNEPGTSWVENIPDATASQSGTMTSAGFVKLRDQAVKSITSGADGFTYVNWDGTSATITGSLQIVSVSQILLPSTMLNSRVPLGYSFSLDSSVLPIVDDNARPMAWVPFNALLKTSLQNQFAGKGNYVSILYSKSGTTLNFEVISNGDSLDRSGDQISGDLLSIAKYIQLTQSAVASGIDAGELYATGINAPDNTPIIRQDMNAPAQLIQATGDGANWVQNIAGPSYNVGENIIQGAQNVNQSTAAVPNLGSTAGLGVANSNNGFVTITLASNTTAEVTQIKALYFGPNYGDFPFFNKDLWYVGNTITLRVYGTYNNQSSISPIIANFGLLLGSGNYLLANESFIVPAGTGNLPLEYTFSATDINDFIHGIVVYFNFVDTGNVNVAFNISYIEASGNFNTDGTTSDQGGSSTTTTTTGISQVIESIQGSTKIISDQGDILLETPNGYTVIDQYRQKHASIMEPITVNLSTSGVTTSAGVMHVDLSKIKSNGTVVIDNYSPSTSTYYGINLYATNKDNVPSGMFWEVRSTNCTCFCQSYNCDARVQAVRADVISLYDNDSNKKLFIAPYSSNSTGDSSPVIPSSLTLMLNEPANGTITATNNLGNSWVTTSTNVEIQNVPNDGSWTFTFAWTDTDNSGMVPVQWSIASEEFLYQNSITWSPNQFEGNYVSVNVNLDSVILINNVTDWQNFANAINYNSTSGGIDGTNYGNGKLYKLTADLDLSSINNIPVGAVTQTGFSSKFSGTFDGNGHTISNVNTLSNGNTYHGLFGLIDHGIVTNLIVNNISYGTSYGLAYAGTIAGCVMNGGLISNCAFTGAVTTNNSNFSYIGLIVGLMNNNSSFPVNVWECMVIPSNNNISLYYNSVSAGLIAGCYLEDYSTMPDYRIVRCIAIDPTGSNPVFNTSGRAGGILGDVQGSFSSATNVKLIDLCAVFAFAVGGGISGILAGAPIPHAGEVTYSYNSSPTPQLWGTSVGFPSTGTGMSRSQIISNPGLGIINSENEWNVISGFLPTLKILPQVNIPTWIQ